MAEARLVPFIQHQGGKFVICDAGAQLLRSVDGAITVVAVAGLYRTGKSFLLNQLVRSTGDVGKKASESDSFAVGDTIQSCTRGINIWVPEQLKANDGSTLVLMGDSIAHRFIIGLFACQKNNYLFLNLF